MISWSWLALSFMTVNSLLIDASDGATISLDMQFPTVYLYEPKLFYQLVVSTSGTTYGSAFGLPNPLISDYLFDLTSNGIYPGPFFDAKGELDANGTARTKLILGSDDANPYVGMTFSFSCAFWEQPTFGELIFRGFARPASVQVVP